MTRLENILVVGATGQLGSRVVRHVANRGKRIRALVRETSNVQPLLDQGVELAYGSLDDPDSLARACNGVEGVVATASSIVPRKGDRFGERDITWYENLITACKANHVTRLVYISAFTTSFDDQVPEFLIKRQIEEIIVDSGIGHTIFRGAAFMDVYFAAMGSSIPLVGVSQPTLERGFWATRVFRGLTRHLIERRGIALVPGNGSARHAFIAVDDVAAFLAKALDHEDFDNVICDIGGPSAPSWNEVVAIYESQLGRRIRTVRLPVGLLHTLQVLLGRFSPGAANLMAILKLLGRENYDHDSSAIAGRFGVELTSAESFLSEKVQLYRQSKN